MAREWLGAPQVFVLSGLANQNSSLPAQAFDLLSTLLHHIELYFFCCHLIDEFNWC